MGGMASQGISIDGAASQGGMTSRGSMRANNPVGYFVGREIEGESNSYTSGVGDGSVGDGGVKFVTPRLRTDTSRNNGYVHEVVDGGKSYARKDVDGGVDGGGKSYPREVRDGSSYSRDIGESGVEGHCSSYKSGVGDRGKRGSNHVTPHQRRKKASRKIC